MILHRRLFPHAAPLFEIELTARLVSGSGSIAIVGLVAGAMSIQAILNHDLVPAGLLFSLALVAIARVTILRRLRCRHGSSPPDLSIARRWERQFAFGSFASSLLVGVANVYVLSYRDPPLALLAVCALCCYVFSLILRTAVRPRVCLPSVAVSVGLTAVGLPPFMNDGSRLNPTFALAALATTSLVLALSSIQLAGHLYRTTLDQLVAQRDLLRFARQDPLTGLNNRLALRERFEAMTSQSTPPAALFYIDLDEFKPVNDAHGHQVGDALLCQAATRIGYCIQPDDGAFRIGGDEFAVLVSRLRHPNDTTSSVLLLARHLLSSLSESYQLNGTVVRISASIGIALSTVELDLDDMTAIADAALYEAKRSGRGTFRLEEFPARC